MFHLEEILAENQSKLPKVVVRSTHESLIQKNREGYHIWSILSSNNPLDNELEHLESRQRRIAIMRKEIVCDIADNLIRDDTDQMPWWQRIEWANDSQSFKRFMSLLRVPNERWRSSRWFYEKSSLPLEKGGAGKDLQSLGLLAWRRFGSHKGFVARLDGHLPFGGFQSKSEALDALYSEIRRLRSGGEWINNLPTKHPILRQEKEEISKEQYYNNNIVVAEVADYLQNGINREKNPPHASLYVPDKVEGVPVRILNTVKENIVELRQKYSWCALCEATVDIQGLFSEESHIHRTAEQKRHVGEYVARALIKERDRNWRQRVNWCRSTQDWYSLILLLGIRPEQLRLWRWWVQDSKKSTQEGGIGINLDFLMYDVIKNEYGTFYKFLDALDDYLLNEKLFLKHFELDGEFNETDAGLANEFYLSCLEKKSTTLAAVDLCPSLEEIEKLKKHNDIKKSNKRLEVMKKLGKVVVSYDRKSMPERIRELESPKEFLKFFALIGVPKDLWRNPDKFHSFRNEEGAMIYTQVVNGIKADPRFGEGYTSFLSWMGAESQSFVDIVNTFRVPADAIMYFNSLKLTDEQWSNYEWWASKAKLLPEEGGIGKNMVGFTQAIRFDDRWDGSWRKFISWVKGKEIMYASEKSRLCLTPDDFLQWFTEEGIPGDKWKNTHWLVNISKLPFEQEGVGSSKRHVFKAIINDGRFDSWDAFLVWMGENIIQSWRERIVDCTCANDFKALFASLKIPGENWRKGSYLKKNGLVTLYDKICRDPRFRNWSTFLACMDGRLPFEGIQNQQQAREILQQEILQLRQSGKWIVGSIKSTKITRAEYDEIVRPVYYKNNAVVRAVVDFFQSKEKKV